MIIRNARIFRENDFEYGDLCIEDGRIVESCPENDQVIDAGGLTAIPGLIDIHFHGAMGRDFCDASTESIRIIADYEAASGVLAICPATMTISEDRLIPIMEAAAGYKSESGADLVGINLEGPFISPDKTGAQNPQYVMQADGAMFERLQKASNNLIRLVDIAPEIGDNLAFIDKYKNDVAISIAHTCADYDTARKAFKMGARHMTHLYNAMPGINHRNPGPILAALESDCRVELIADGIHIHPAVVRFTFQVFGSDRVILISDSLESTGLDDGKYTLGGQSITVRDKRAVLTEHPDTIAGSSTNLYDCMKIAILDMQIPMHSAVKAATINPARAIGIDREYGSLQAGCRANILLVNESLDIIKIIKDGRL